MCTTCDIDYTSSNFNPLPLPPPLTHLLPHPLLINLIQHTRHLVRLIPPFHKAQRGKVKTDRIALSDKRVPQVRAEFKELCAQDPVSYDLRGRSAEEEREDAGGEDCFAVLPRSASAVSTRKFKELG